MSLIVETPMMRTIRKIIDAAHLPLLNLLLMHGMLGQVAVGAKAMSHIVEVLRNDRNDVAIVNDAIDTLAIVFTPAAVRINSPEMECAAERNDGIWMGREMV